MQQRRVLQRRRGGAYGTSVLLLVAALAACNGKIGANGGAGQVSVGATVYGPTGLHRLSRIEYDNTLADLLGDNSRAGFASLPEDVNDPFDNDFSTQVVSGALIGSAETLAAGAAARLLADTTKRDTLVGCTPSGAGDQACLESFVRAFGRRAFRRPLTEDEVSGYLGLSAFATETNDFYVGVELVLRRDPAGPELPLPRRDRRRRPGQTGSMRSTTTRSAPACRISCGARRRRIACSTWRPRARCRPIRRASRGRDWSCSPIRAAPNACKQFHAFWLAYDQLPLTADMASAMRAETDALVARVVFERHGDYFDLFDATETFVNDMLATHYGLTPPGSTTGAWVLVRLEPAPRHPVARHAARGRREVRRHQPHAARRVRAQPAALPDHRRRHRRPSRSTSRPPPRPRARARSTATPRTAAAAAPTATTRPIRSASASRTTIGPALTGRPTRTTRSARSPATARSSAWARSTARPGWRT